jgi:hypothetical protein
MTDGHTREAASKRRRAQRDVDAIVETPWFRGMLAAIDRAEREAATAEVDADSGDGEP